MNLEISIRSIYRYVDYVDRGMNVSFVILRVRFDQCFVKSIWQNATYKMDIVMLISLYTLYMRYRRLYA